MTKLTAEEKLARKNQRLKEQEEAVLRFPGCFYTDDYASIQLILDAGEQHRLLIRTDDINLFEVRTNSSWREAAIWLEALEAVTRLVVALTVRLNVMIDEANAKIEACPPIKQLSRLKK